MVGKALKVASKQGRRNPSEDDTLKRVMTLLRQGQLGKAKKLLLSLGLGDMTDANLIAQIERKTPERGEALPGELPNDVPFEKIEIELHQRYHSLRRFAGAGPDGFRNEYSSILFRCLTRLTTREPRTRLQATNG